MKDKYKKGDKVCVHCAVELDKNNSSLPWFSQQLKDKDKWINELLQEVELLKEQLDESYGFL